MAEEEKTLAVAISRLDNLVSDITDIKATLRELVGVVARLAVLEERQQADRDAVGRAFGEIRGLDGRVDRLEQERPITQQANAWVHKAVGLVLAAAVGGLLGGVIHPQRQEPAPPAIVDRKP